MYLGTRLESAQRLYKTVLSRRGSREELQETVECSRLGWGKLKARNQGDSSPTIYFYAATLGKVRTVILLNGTSQTRPFLHIKASNVLRNFWQGVTPVRKPDIFSIQDLNCVGKGREALEGYLSSKLRNRGTAADIPRLALIKRIPPQSNTASTANKATNKH